jgi:hypothetical protein
MSKSSSRSSPTPPQDQPQNAEGAATEPPELISNEPLAASRSYRFALLFFLGAMLLLGSSLLIELILSLFR